MTLSLISSILIRILLLIICKSFLMIKVTLKSQMIILLVIVPNMSLITNQQEIYKQEINYVDTIQSMTLYFLKMQQLLKILLWIMLMLLSLLQESFSLIIKYSFPHLSLSTIITLIMPFFLMFNINFSSRTSYLKHHIPPHLITTLMQNS